GGTQRPGLERHPEPSTAHPNSVEPVDSPLCAVEGDGLMKFFFPDAQDLVDPSFNFDTETRSEHRLRQRDDQYAHEVFGNPPYDGLLVSKAIVEGQSSEGSRYTLAQRHRLLREGAKEFFRINGLKLEIMG